MPRPVHFAGVAALACLVLGLSGCSAADPAAQGQQPAPAESSSGEAQAGPAASRIPEADAVETQLAALAAQAPKPSRDAVRDAYAAAGFAPESIEVSQDITPTGLAVDSIVAGAPVAGECVVGEVRSGAVTVTVVPALASGQCLIGDDR
ncbi:hypothetical protein H9639_03675 [Arthrobacter sp. Sa2CUA1]|uniref:DUF6993 domain-containing protein n=1 Tax=Arthrobacter gallicola TaxID=2762225 RepID=A0ABR8UP82_9MICC|nr:hypothetical protein [Arthrobacter gallicola]